MRKPFIVALDKFIEMYSRFNLRLHMIRDIYYDIFCYLNILLRLNRRFRHPNEFQGWKIIGRVIKYSVRLQQNVDPYILLQQISLILVFVILMKRTKIPQSEEYINVHSCKPIYYIFLALLSSYRWIFILVEVVYDLAFSLFFPISTKFYVVYQNISMRISTILQKVVMLVTKERGKIRG